MNLFKKKYKKSEWYRGLLAAEERANLGWSRWDILVWASGGNLETLCTKDGTVVECVRLRTDFWFVQGVADYLEYRKEYLK